MAHLVIDKLYIKIVIRINKKFAIEAKVKQVVLEIIVVNKIDKVDKSDKVDKHREIILS